MLNHPNLEKPIAVGRTAEIFAWEPGTVLKLLRPGFLPGLIDQEASVTRAVIAAGVRAPTPGEIVEVDGRRGLVYERVDGPSLLVEMTRSVPARGVSPRGLAGFIRLLRDLESAARLLANLHVSMHSHAAPGLPSQRERFLYLLENNTALTPALRERALQALARLPDGDRVCHGDFHPENVLITRSGPVIIDWEPAVRGSPAADLARTSLLLRVPYMNGARNRFQRQFVAHFHRRYLAHYRALSPSVLAHYPAWMPVTAALRLREDIPLERPRLLSIIRRAWGQSILARYGSAGESS